MFSTGKPGQLKVGEKLEGIDMKELGRINPLVMIGRLIILCLISSAAAAAILFGPLWLQGIGILFMGLMFAHAVELQHQCLHNTAFKSHSWNRFVGFLLGLAALVSHSDYQHQHMRHHRLLGTKDDREFFNYGYDRLSLATFIPHIFMIRHYKGVAGDIFKAVFGGFQRDAKPESTRKIRNEYRLFFLFLAAMAAVSIILWTPLFVKLWLLPLLVAIPGHALIELPEHVGCDLSTTNVLENTRSVRAGRLAVWFVHGNNYHTEHHWLPSIPNHNLPQLRGRIEPGIVHYELSYPAFFRAFFGALLRGARMGKLGTGGAKG